MAPPRAPSCSAPRPTRRCWRRSRDAAPDIGAQVLHARDREWAVTVDDVVRRTGLQPRGADDAGARERIATLLEEEAMSSPLICAHRGASADHADNSAAAFAAAIAAGADLVETDIRRGRDGGAGARARPDRRGRGPAAADRAARPGPRPGRPRPRAEGGRASSATCWRCSSPAHREGLIVTSFLPEVIAEFRRLDETLDLGLLVEQVPGSAGDRAADGGARVRRRLPRTRYRAAGTRGAARRARARPRACRCGRSTTRRPSPSWPRDPDIAIITTDVPALARSIVG